LGETCGIEEKIGSGSEEREEAGFVRFNFDEWVLDCDSEAMTRRVRGFVFGRDHGLGDGEDADLGKVGGIDAGDREVADENVASEERERVRAVDAISRML
jgi:hypothetical protein